ncbi:MAG: serine hydrolase [Anaerolineae bacterium]|nr:serine hydrolase [Anaerolineae bacterium]
MQRIKPIWLIIFVIAISPLVLMAQQDIGVWATAQNQVNIRAAPNIEGELLGQMEIGLVYPIVGRSELFPWVLIANPSTQQPIGWVFRDIVQIEGNLQTVPFSTITITNNPPTAIPTAAQPTQQAVQQNTPLQSSPIPSSTAVFTVAGTVQGEVNVRYGPGTNYPRVGVAQAGDRFQIIAWHTQLPWLQIRYDDSPTNEAWLLIDLLDIEGDIYTLPAISTTNFNLPTLTPTPSVVQSSTQNRESVPLSAGFVALGNQIWQRLLQMGFDPQTSQFASLFLIDLQTGEAMSFGGNIAYRGTSVNKITILATLYQYLDVPPTPSIATDIANTMICSENSATNRLLGVIGDGDEWQGAQNVTTFLNDLGLNNSFLLAPYTVDPENPPIAPYPIAVPQTEADQQRANPELYNQLTVEDMGWVLSAIYQCAYEETGPLIADFPPGTFEPRECRQMVHVMSNNTVDALLKTGVPADTRVAHKHGWVDDTHTNAGIFFTPGGDYVLSMAFHSTQLDATGERYLSFANTLPAFAETSRSVYNYFNPTAPMLSIREGFIPEAASCNFAGTPLTVDLQQFIWDE